MATLHHVEFVVSDRASFCEKLCRQFDLSVLGTRKDSSVEQTCLGNHLRSGCILITQFLDGHDDGDFYSSDTFGWRREKIRRGIDSVVDVAISVKDVPDIVQRAKEAGAEIIQDTQLRKDDNGTIEFAVIKSVVGNILHTVINRDRYCADAFLPGFTTAPGIRPDAENSPMIDGVDHITVVCRRGDADAVMQWYADVLGFTRFFMNRSETDSDGFVLDGGIGLRLKAMEYFHCSENVMYSCGKLDGKTNALKLVIAESLPGHDASNNQVESFLLSHEGPGIQHIGLHTSDIVNAANHARKNGLELQTPPARYYTHVGKLEEIARSGEPIALLIKHGILLDFEDDDVSEFRRYLKQVFSKPVFERKTFFWELIERRGATGFGTGNIAALWWSVQQSLLAAQL